MEENKKNQFVSLEFLDETLDTERRYAVKSALGPIRIYAKSVSDQVAALADRILTAQSDLMLTDEQIRQKDNVNTYDWEPHDYDTWRIAGAKIQLAMINDRTQYIMRAVLDLLETIRKEGAKYE